MSDQCIFREKGEDSGDERLGVERPLLSTGGLSVQGGVGARAPPVLDRAETMAVEVVSASGGDVPLLHSGGHNLRLLFDHCAHDLVEKQDHSLSQRQEPIEAQVDQIKRQISD